MVYLNQYKLVALVSSAKGPTDVRLRRPVHHYAKFAQAITAWRRTVTAPPFLTHPPSSPVPAHDLSSPWEHWRRPPLSGHPLPGRPPPGGPPLSGPPPPPPPRRRPRPARGTLVLRVRVVGPSARTRRWRNSSRRSPPSPWPKRPTPRRWRSTDRREA